MCCLFSTICFQLHVPQIHAEMEHSAFLHDVTRVDSVANVEMDFLDVYASLVSECGIFKKRFDWGLFVVIKVIVLYAFHRRK